MMTRLIAWGLAGALVMPCGAQEVTTPIVELRGVTPQRSAYQVAKRGVPVVIKSAAAAARHFDEAAVGKLQKQVDFKKQIVLLFAWRGSGQDKLEHVLLKSFPEQVRFSLKPGRTRDLRPHHHVYALRSNVKWSSK